jgi:ankyrin repeat protein
MQQSSADFALLHAAKLGLYPACRDLLTASASDPDADAAESTQPRARVDARDEDTLQTPLHHAASEGRVELVKLFLAKHARVDARDGQKRTPLHWAVRNAHTRIVKILLNRGADPNALCSHRNIPLDYLSQRKVHKDSAKRIEKELLTHNSMPPKKFYAVFFCPNKITNIGAWFARLVDSITTIGECKLFYTVVAAATSLALLHPEEAKKWTQEALVRMMSVLEVGSPSKQLLHVMALHAHGRRVISDEIFDLVEAFCRVPAWRTTGSSRQDVKSKTSRTGRIADASRQVTGVDGTRNTVRNCLLYFHQAFLPLKALVRQNWEVPHAIDADDTRQNHLQRKEDLLKKRMVALTGIIGAVVNGILMARREGDPYVQAFLKEAVDLLDADHVDEVWRRTRPPTADGPDEVNDESHAASHLHVGRRIGTAFGSTPTDVERRQFQSGMEILGICQGVLRSGKFMADHVASIPWDDYRHSSRRRRRRNRTSRRSASGSLDSSGSRSQGTRNSRNDADASIHTGGEDSQTSTDASSSRHCPTRSTLSGSDAPSAGSRSDGSRSVRADEMTKAYQIFRDALLSQTDEGGLPLHRAVKYNLVDALREALVVAKGNGTLDATDSQGRTVLDLAARTGQRNLYELILAQGGVSARLSPALLDALLTQKEPFVQSYHLMIAKSFELASSGSSAA